ncbi:MAG: ABC transporter ATP-binding protein [Reyranella sp.]|uniref:ABC transporter ATP-binding protein n=1 Tax=Reyranella sp. TaxID=1929291 RepID=UPI003D0ACE03
MTRILDPLLTVEELTVQHGALTVLGEMSWQVDAGEILGIIGPNGAGKSTCLAAVAHAVERTGEIWLGDDRITDLTTWELARIGVRRTFQHNGFFGDLTLLENAMAAMLLDHSTSLAQSLLTPWREWATRRRAGKAARELLSSFGIAGADHHKRPGEVAYGLQRLLPVVLAYGSGARVLLLDEPAAGLGSADAERLADLLAELRRRRVAVVVAEHHMDFVMTVADRILVIDQGRKLAEGKAADIGRDDMVREAYLGRAA